VKRSPSVEKAHALRGVETMSIELQRRSSVNLLREKENDSRDKSFSQTGAAHQMRC
jgi:hypothetical protein